MPIYKDCTLGELLIVTAIVFLVLNITLGLVTKIFTGFAWIGFAIAFLLTLHTTRFALGRLQKLKYGKPYGYYQQLFLIYCHQHALLKTVIPLPFLCREGKWSVRRGIHAH
jgi:conjugative transfer region protein (TIGR03750 family)